MPVRRKPKPSPAIRLRFVLIGVAAGSLCVAGAYWTSTPPTNQAMQRYNLPVEPPAVLGADSDARFCWASIPGPAGQHDYQTGVFRFHEPGFVDLRLTETSRPVTRLELRACLVPEDYDQRPYIHGRSGPEPTPAGNEDPVDLPALSAGLSLQLRPHDAGEARELGRWSLGGPFREHVLHADLPAGYTPGQDEIQIEVTPHAPARVLVYRISAYAPEPRPRRVVLISLDTHALCHMSLLDEQPIDTSPTLRAMLHDDNGTVLFSGARAVSNWTLPTHATMLTGVYPSHHRLIETDNRVEMMNPRLEALPELLKADHVETYILASHVFLSPNYGFHAGLDVFRLYEQPFGQRGRAVFRDAVSLLDKARDRDVFMLCHLFDAHEPYTNFPANHAEITGGLEADYPEDIYFGKLYGQIYGGKGWRPDHRRRNIAEHGPTINAKMPAARAAYQLGLRDVDDMLGEFFAALKQRGLYDGTTFLIISDHGEEFFAHGMLTHTSLYPENQNVPFLMRFAAGAPQRALLADLKPLRGDVRASSAQDSGRKEPLRHAHQEGGRLGKVVPYRFEAHSAVFRCVLDLFGLERPAYVAEVVPDALSLEDLLSLDADREVFAEMYMTPRDTFYEATLITPDGWQGLFSTLLTDDEQWRIDDPVMQLYNLAADPQCLHDESTALPQLSASLQQRIIDRVHHVRQNAWPPAQGEAASHAEIEHLRTLGYVR